MTVRQIRLAADISMTLVLPLLMAYSLIGEAFHEIAGTAMLVLFIVHHILNRRWYGALFKGRYNASRVFRTVLDTLLLVFMILQPASGILMSKHLYTFLPSLPLSAQARGMHMLLAYWGYVLMCMHAGTHLTVLFSKLGRQKNGIRIPVYCILGAISAYGCHAFVKRGFPGYMAGTTAFAFFDYSEPLAFFILDYLAVMVLFFMTGLVLISVLNRCGRRERQGRQQNTSS